MVIEHSLDHVRMDLDVTHAGGNRPTEIAQLPRLHLAVERRSSASLPWAHSVKPRIDRVPNKRSRSPYGNAKRTILSAGGGKSMRWALSFFDRSSGNSQVLASRSNSLARIPPI